MITKDLERPPQILETLERPADPQALEALYEQPASQPASMLPFAALLAAVCILSCSAIFTRLSEEELTASATIFNRFWIASLALGLWSGFQQFRQPPAETDQTSQPIQIRDLLWFGCLGILIYGRAGSWAWSLTQTSVANSNLLHNMTPLFATLGGWLFLGHRFNRQFLMGMSLAITGVLIIGVGDFQVGPSGLVGDGTALLSAVFYAANFWSLKTADAFYHHNHHAVLLFGDWTVDDSDCVDGRESAISNFYNGLASGYCLRRG